MISLNNVSNYSPSGPSSEDFERERPSSLSDTDPSDFPRRLLRNQEDSGYPKSRRNVKIKHEIQPSKLRQTTHYLDITQGYAQQERQFNTCLSRLEECQSCDDLKKILKDIDAIKIPELKTQACIAAAYAVKTNQWESKKQLKSNEHMMQEKEENLAWNMLLDYTNNNGEGNNRFIQKTSRFLTKKSLSEIMRGLEEFEIMKGLEELENIPSEFQNLKIKGVEFEVILFTNILAECIRSYQICELINILKKKSPSVKEAVIDAVINKWADCSIPDSQVFEKITEYIQEISDIQIQTEMVENQLKKIKESSLGEIKKSEMAYYLIVSILEKIENNSSEIIKIGIESSFLKDSEYREVLLLNILLIKDEKSQADIFEKLISTNLTKFGFDLKKQIEVGCEMLMKVKDHPHVESLLIAAGHSSLMRYRPFRKKLSEIINSMEFTAQNQSEMKTILKKIKLQNTGSYNPLTTSFLFNAGRLATGNKPIF